MALAMAQKTSWHTIVRIFSSIQGVAAGLGQIVVHSVALHRPNIADTLGWCLRFRFDRKKTTSFYFSHSFCNLSSSYVAPSSWVSSRKKRSEASSSWMSWAMDEDARALSRAALEARRSEQWW